MMVTTGGRGAASGSSSAAVERGLFLRASSDTSAVPASSTSTPNSAHTSFTVAMSRTELTVVGRPFMNRTLMTSASLTARCLARPVSGMPDSETSRISTFSFFSFLSSRSCCFCLRRARPARTTLSMSTVDDLTNFMRPRPPSSSLSAYFFAGGPADLAGRRLTLSGRAGTSPSFGGAATAGGAEALTLGRPGRSPPIPPLDGRSNSPRSGLSLPIALAGRSRSPSPSPSPLGLLLMRSLKLGLSRSPLGRSRSPVGRSRKGRSRSPAGLSRSPAGLSRSPAGLSRSPAGRSRSPNGLARSPPGLSESSRRTDPPLPAPPRLTLPPREATPVLPPRGGGRGTTFGFITGFGAREGRRISSEAEGGWASDSSCASTTLRRPYDAALRVRERQKRRAPLQSQDVDKKPLRCRDAMDSSSFSLHAKLGYLAGFFYSWEDSDNPVRNARRGVIAMATIFLLMSTVFAPDSMLIRPHPIIWKLVFGVGSLYILVLVYTLEQTPAGARGLLKHLDPSLGVELPERKYGTDCRLYTPDDPESRFRNLKDTLLDEFVVAHLLGWMCKALVFRDMKVLMALSVLFELLELTFQHMLPNFNECWWDSWIIDVAGCNMLGIWLGMSCVHFMEMKKYRWTGISQIPGVVGKVKRSMGQLTPFSWDHYDWHFRKGPKRFLQILLLLAITEVMELNAFFLKTILWVPPPSPLNVYRLAIFFFLAIPATREYYQYITNEDCKRLGPFAWLTVAALILEVMACVKFGKGMFPAPWPTTVLLSWSIVGVILFVFILVWSVLLFLERRKATEGKKTR
eukprot:jgi/Mesvir1/26381/Mv16845-RA.1